MSKFLTFRKPHTLTYSLAAMLLVLLSAVTVSTRKASALQNDQPVIGPGLPNVGSLAPRSSASSTKAGSILFFPKYTSSTQQPGAVNTLFTLTNTNPRDGVALRLSWIHNCQIDTTFMTLSANQTKTFLASELNPNQTGYLMVMAVGSSGIPLQFNWVIGTASYKDATGYEANYNAIAVAKRSGGLTRTNADLTIADVNFNNVDYDRLPKSVAVDNLQNQSAATGGDAQTKTAVTLFTPPANLGSSATQQLKIEAVAFDLSARGYPQVVDNTCGLNAPISNIWSNVNEFITPTRQGWARFGANINNVAVPLMGLSLTEGVTVADARHSARPMQALTWLDSFKMSVPVVPPTSGAPVDPVSQTQPEAVGDGVSEMKAGSALIYNRFASGVYGSTRLSLTNTHPSARARIRMFFSGLVEPALVNETIIILNPTQTTTLNVQDIAPNQKGWVFAVAIDGRAQMTQHNFLIGSAVVSEQATGVVAGYNALAISKNATGVVGRNDDGTTANLRFNDEQFDRLPATLALNAVQNQTDATTFFGFGRPPLSFFDAPNTRGLISVTMFDDLLASAGATVGPIETRIGLIRVNAQTPPIASTIQRGHRGWMKILSSAPLLAWNNNLVNAPFSTQGGGNWAGSFPGGGNVHILSTASDYTLRSAANNPNNRAPVADFESFPAINLARSATGVNIRLDGRVSTDPDGEDDPLSFKWYDNDVLISTAKVTDYRFKLGTHVLKLVVLDGNNTPSEPKEYFFQVNDEIAPVMSGIPSAITKTTGSAAGIALNYTLPYAWDEVDGPIIVTASKSPGSVFPIGKTTVIFKARDNAGNESTATMLVTVNKGTATLPTIGGIPSNKLPVMRTPNDQYVLVNKTKTLNLVANDEDGDAVTFRLLNAPSYARIDAPDPVTRSAKLIIEPRDGDPIVTTIARIEATDSKGGKTLTQQFRIQISDFATVEDGSGSGPGGPDDPGTGVGGGGGGGGGGGATNKPPVAVAKPIPATVKATSKQGGVVSLDASGSSDPDLDPLTYEWKDGNTVISGEQIGTVTLPVGIHSITLTVSDGKGGTSTTSAQVVEILPRDLTITSASPARITQFNQMTITVTGTGFFNNADPAKQTKLRFDCTSFCSGGSQITVTINSIEEDKIVATIKTTQKTPLGNRDAIVSNPDGASAKLLRSNYVSP